MRSLPATYNNTLYRSRLEGRWKIFYDLTGIEATYEPEALDLDGLMYIPDFYLNPFQAWNEIKGEIVSDEEGLRILEKCKRLAKQSDRPVILNFRDPLSPICAVFREDRAYLESRWSHCEVCGKLSLLVKEGSYSFNWCPRRHEAAPLGIRELGAARRKLFDAAVKAHNHRFGITRKRDVRSY